MSKLNIIKTNAEVFNLINYLADKDLVAVDTETTGVDKESQIIGYSICADEQEAFYVILKEWNSTNKTLITLETEGTAVQMFELLKTKNIVGHNFMFDAGMIENNYKVSLIESLHTCTMTLAHLLNENRRIGLKDLGTFYFGAQSTDEQTKMKDSVIANGGVLTKEKFELYKADSDLIARYGAQDAVLTFKLFMILIPELYEQGLQDFFFSDETMPLLKGPAYDLNTTGLKVDLQALQTLKQTLEVECAEAKDFIYSEITHKITHKYPGTNKKNTFNIGSSQQMAWLLFGEMGLEFNTLTKAGKEICRALGLKLPYTFLAKREFIATCSSSKGHLVLPEGAKAKKVRDPWAYIACDKEALKKHATRYKWIEKLLDYQKKQKILNTYVLGIEERVKYGICRPSFLMHGTTSGRFSSRNPNLQNLPRDDQRVKDCFVARPGKVFVGADYSQLEPRVFAYMSGDERLKAVFNTANDFYSFIGMRVYNKTDCLPLKEGHPDAFGVKYPKLRKSAKEIALAATYGASAFRLMKFTGKSAEDTQMDMDNYFEEFPAVAQMMLNSHKEAKDKGRVLNLFGRPRRMPEAKLIPKRYGDKNHADLPYEARNVLNLAVNHTIQSTGASIVNRAMIQFYSNIKELGIDCKIVSQIHDELIVECLAEDAESVALLLQDAMENTTLLPGVPLEAVPRITKTLAK